MSSPAPIMDRLLALSPEKRTVLSQRLSAHEAPPGRRTGTDDAAARRPDPELVAYVVFRDDSTSELGNVRSHVAEQLPGYMIPSRFVELTALPLGDTGKVDKQALPHPGAPPADTEAGFVAPTTEQERQLAGIWAAVLGVDLVGIHDDFFEIGGHSLLAVQLLGKVREAFGVDLPMDALFDAPTVAGTLERITTLRWAAAETAREDGPDDGDATKGDPTDGDSPSATNPDVEEFEL